MNCKIASLLLKSSNPIRKCSTKQKTLSGWNEQPNSIQWIHNNYFHYSSIGNLSHSIYSFQMQWIRSFSQKSKQFSIELSNKKGENEFEWNNNNMGDDKSIEFSDLSADSFTNLMEWMMNNSETQQRDGQNMVKWLETCNSTQISFIWNQISDNYLQLSKSTNGYLFMNKLITQSSKEHSASLERAMKGIIEEICLNANARKTMISVLKRFQICEIPFIHKELREVDLKRLAGVQGGIEIINELIESSTSEDSVLVLKLFKFNEGVSLLQSKLAESNSAVISVIFELTKNHYSQFLNSPRGNLIFQAFIDVCNGEMLSEIFDCISIDLIVMCEDEKSRASVAYLVNRLCDMGMECKLRDFLKDEVQKMCKKEGGREVLKLCLQKFKDPQFIFETILNQEMFSTLSTNQNSFSIIQSCMDNANSDNRSRMVQLMTKSRLVPDHGKFRKIE
eukprot:TRINITY_DN4357_c0_g1_i1.p1 TRINITY_DN4357_c0_g1~~TRINITY_DN4357_c0_g1_i1.p1  ORF type:complete len:449 (+),score=83.25 TRINITY_DN4357_c0_g1_i1:166-1512(+)